MGVGMWCMTLWVRKVSLKRDGARSTQYWFANGLTTRNIACCSHIQTPPTIVYSPGECMPGVGVNHVRPECWNVNKAALPDPRNWEFEEVWQ